MTTLSMVRGDTPTFDVVVVHPITHDPVDLTDAAITMKAATTYQGPDPTFEVSTVSGDITLDPEQDNRAFIKLPTDATSALVNEFHRLWFEVTVDMGTDTWTTDRGMLVVQPQLTGTVP